MKYRFRLNTGSHRETTIKNGRKVRRMYKPGDHLESDRDLSKVFGKTKFTKVKKTNKNKPLEDTTPVGPSRRERAIKAADAARAEAEKADAAAEKKAKAEKAEKAAADKAAADAKPAASDAAPDDGLAVTRSGNKYIVTQDGEPVDKAKPTKKATAEKKLAKLRG